VEPADSAVGQADEVAQQALALPEDDQQALLLRSRMLRSAELQAPEL